VAVGQLECQRGAGCVGGGDAEADATDRGKDVAAYGEAGCVWQEEGGGQVRVAAYTGVAHNFADGAGVGNGRRDAGYRRGLEGDNGKAGQVPDGVVVDVVRDGGGTSVGAGGEESEDGKMSVIGAVVVRHVDIAAPGVVGTGGGGLGRQKRGGGYWMREIGKSGSRRGRWRTIIWLHRTGRGGRTERNSRSGRRRTISRAQSPQFCQKASRRYVTEGELRLEHGHSAQHAPDVRDGGVGWECKLVRYWIVSYCLRTRGLRAAEWTR